ncbi:MAG: alpha/beta fold hydrolase, partial [Myxococcota bacterium]
MWVAAGLLWCVWITVVVIAAWIWMVGLIGCGTVNRYDNVAPMAFDELDYGAPVRTVTLDGVEVAYVDQGRPEGRPLVLVHGLGEHVGYWRRNMGAWAQWYRVVAIDLPGYGHSAKPAQPFSMRGYADVVRGVMDHVGLEQAVVVGHSMGGQVALTMALRHPERVRGLVL